MKSLLRGIIFLILVSAILLLSDLQNRNGSALRKNNESRNLTVTGKVKLAVVHYVDSPNSEDCEKGIRKALGDNNLSENEDFTMKVFNAQGDVSTLNSISQSLAGEKWDLVFAISTPSVQLLTKKLQGQKIVFTNVADPVIAGLGKSFDDHLPDVTGVSTMSDFEGLIKLSGILKPGMKLAGTVYTPSEINSVAYKDYLVRAAKKAGIEVIAAPANSATEVMDAANSLVSRNIEAFCQISDNLVGSSGSSIIKVSYDNKIPCFGFVASQFSLGAVAVCARDYVQAGYEAGEMGIEVLAGKSPGKIPFRYVTLTHNMVNREAAAFFSIKVPDDLNLVIPAIEIVDKLNK